LSGAPCAKGEEIARDEAAVAAAAVAAAARYEFTIQSAPLTLNRRKTVAKEVSV